MLLYVRSDRVSVDRTGRDGIASDKPRPDFHITFWVSPRLPARSPH